MKSKSTHRRALTGSLVGTAMGIAAPCILLASCATLQQIVALRQVDFALDRVSDARLAGVAMTGISSYGDLSAIDVARIGAALASGELPLELTVHVNALNPSDNDVTARLIQMDWTLPLERDLIDLALAATGAGGEPTRIAVRATPRSRRRWGRSHTRSPSRSSAARSAPRASGALGRLALGHRRSHIVRPTPPYFPGGE